MSIIILMLKKPKIIIFISLVLLAIISVAYILVTTKNHSTTQTSVNTLPTPNIPNYFQTGLSSTLEIQQSNFNFPATLPVLEKQNTTTLNTSAAGAIASRLGFTTSPIEGSDAVNGTVLIWNNKNNFLTITPKINKIKFGPSENPATIIPGIINKQLSDQALQAIATDFLNNKIQVPANSLSFSNFVYLIPKAGQELFQVTDKATAKIIQLNYSLQNTNYPILTQDPNSTIAYVQVLLDGTVLNSEINYGLSYTPGLTEYNIFNYSRFTKNTNTAILVSLNDGSVNLPDIAKDQLSDIVLKTVELGYLYDSSDSTFLSPIFILRGTAKLSGYTNPLTAVFYLPAIVSP